MKEKFTKYSLYTISTVLFVFFLIWALLSANGRTINFWNNQEEGPAVTFVQTGGIRIISNYADNILAEIDGQKAELKENRLERIEPGNRQIKLSLAEFNDWYTNIEIKPGIVVDINPLFLPTSLNLETKISSFMNIDKNFYSDYGDYVYYVVSSSPKGIENGIFKYNLVASQSIFGNTTNAPIKISNIGEEISTPIETQEYKIIPSPDNRKILFYSTETGYLIYSADGSDINQIPLNLETKLGYLPEEVYWLNGSSSLVIKHSNLLSEFELVTERIMLIDYNPTSQPVFGVNGDTVVFYSNANEELYSYRNETRVPIKLDNVEVPADIKSLIVDKTTGSKIILNANNTYYYLNTIDSYLTKIDSNIIPIEFSKDGSALIFSKEGNAYSFVIEEIKPLGKFETSQKLLISNFDPTTTKLKWTNSSSYIMIIELLENDVNLSLADKKGENIIDVINNPGIDEESVYVRNDNKELTLLMIDSNEDTEISNKNLYYISLFEEN